MRKEAKVGADAGADADAETNTKPRTKNKENESSESVDIVKVLKKAKRKQESASSKLWRTVIICCIFMIVEFVGGILANSIAIMSDAAHLASDFCGFVISLFAIWMSAQPASSVMTFGYHRAEVIGAVCSVILIWGLTIWLVYEAVLRVILTPEVNGLIMIITAAIGLAFNIVKGTCLHSHGFGHSHHHHEHGHKDKDKQKQKQKHTPEHTHKHKNKHKHEPECENENEKDNEKGHEQKHENPPEHKKNEKEEKAQPHDHDHDNDHGHDHNQEQDQEQRQGINQNRDENREDKDKQKKKSKSKKGHIHTKLTPLKYRRESFGDEAQELIQPFLSDMDDNMGKVLDKSVPLDIPEPRPHNDVNVNVRAAMIHIIGDILQSVGVLIAATIIYVWPSWTICDPICTFVFSIIVVFTTVPIVRDCVRVLMEGTPHGLDMDMMTGDFKLVS